MAQDRFILWRLRLRCASFWLRGFFWWGPAPYHSDGRCFSRGLMVSSTILLMMVPAGLAGAAFLLGRCTR